VPYFYFERLCNNDFNNDIWHSRLCHANLYVIKRLSNMFSFPEYKHVKGSKCGISVQPKQPRNPIHN